MAIDSVRRSLAPDRDAAAAARRALDGFRGQLEEDVIERSALVVTEVVTNGVTHAGLTAAQPIDLNIQALAGCLRIEVTVARDAGVLLMARSRDATCRLQAAAAPGGACDHVRGGMHRDQA